MSSQRLAAGLDIGGTKTLAVAVDRRGAILGQARLATDARDGDAVASTAVAALDVLAAEVGHPVDAFEVVGAGLPGWVVAGLGNREPRAEPGRGAGAGGDRLAHHPAHGRADPRGERRERRGRRGLHGMACPDLAYLSIGTGVAAGLLLDGRLRRGALGVAGEIGHLPVDPAGPVCECGQRGCLEMVASGSAIARRWPSSNGRAASDLFAAAEAGDPTAVRAAAEVATHLATAVVTLSLAVDPAVIVLGGGVAEVGRAVGSGRPVSRHRSGAAVRVSRLPGSRPGACALVPDGLPVGALGAALLAWQRFTGDTVLPAVAGGAG